jgi:hypothetical protein
MNILKSVPQIQINQQKNRVENRKHQFLTLESINSNSNKETKWFSG